MLEKEIGLLQGLYVHMTTQHRITHALSGIRTHYLIFRTVQGHIHFQLILFFSYF